MATIKCSECGRYIQDSDKSCLYCNAANLNYKEKELGAFGSFGSFGSSFGSDTFSSSSFGSDFKSSFDTPATPTDFGVGKDFLDADKYSMPQPDVQDKFVLSETMPEQRDKYDFAKTSLSSYFEPATPDNDDNTLSVAAGCEKPLPTDKSTPTPSSCPLVNSRTPSSDYKVKLDNYRKVNGYGEYAVSTVSKRTTSKRSNATAHNNSYTPPHYDYGGGPIDGPVDTANFGPLDLQESSRRSNQANQATVWKIIGCVIGFYILQFILKVIFILAS